MKYKKYRIVKEFGKFYIEIPFLIFFWKRLGYWKHQEIAFNSHKAYYLYKFDDFQEANSFAAKHRYEIMPR